MFQTHLTSTESASPGHGICPDPLHPPCSQCTPIWPGMAAGHRACCGHMRPSAPLETVSLGNGVQARGRLPACGPGPRGLCLSVWPCSKHADSLSTPKSPHPQQQRGSGLHRGMRTLRTPPGPAPGWQKPPSLMFPAGTCPAWELPGSFSPVSSPSPTPDNHMKQTQRDAVLLSMICKVSEGIL